MNDWGHFSAGIIIADARVDATINLLYVQVDTYMIHGALNVLVKVNSKLIKKGQNSYWK